MWKMAERFGVDGVRDLTDQQYDDCLRKVHAYFSMHPGQWQQGKVKKVEKGKGPAHHRERADKGAREMKHEKECYNGVDGGQVYKYYAPGTFARILKNAFGVSWDKITERQCMDALRATNDELKHYPQKCCQLRHYAGPQCYPQLFEESRRFANGSNVEQESPEVSLEMGRERRLMENCWLRCDAC